MLALCYLTLYIFHIDYIKVKASALICKQANDHLACIQK
jgi:hypothetical protein